MSQAPRGEVRENVLARLIAPHRDIARKRVTLLYRVIDPGEAARIVERDLHNAEFRVNSAARPTARAVVEQQAARATAQEEARGAALVNFGMLVTTTVLDEEQLQLATAALANLAPTARVGLRPVWGSQDSAFAAALPVGVFLPGAPEGPRADPPGAMSLSRRRQRPEGRRQGPLLPGPRGWHGAAAGRSVYLQTPAEWRGTSVQACGLWPFSVGAGAPLIGAPLGKHLLTGATVCGDPISWFQRASLLTAPTAFVMGLQGFGKSSCIRRMALALAGFGVLPLVLGDLKPDYVDLIGALDGQVIRLGRGRGYLNVLDIELAKRAAARLGDGEHAQARARAARRRGRPPAHDGLRADHAFSAGTRRAIARTRSSPRR